MRPRIRLLALFSATLALPLACDAGDSTDPNGPDGVGGKADSDSDATGEEAEGDTDGDTEGVAPPIRLHIQVDYDCGEMGDDLEPFDDPGLTNDDGELRYVLEAELPALCRTETSADCRIGLPTRCWSTSVSVRAGTLSVNADAGDFDSGMSASAPLIAADFGDGLQADSSPDNASGGFGNVGFTVRSP